MKTILTYWLLLLKPKIYSIQNVILATYAAPPVMFMHITLIHLNCTTLIPFLMQMSTLTRMKTYLASLMTMKSTFTTLTLLFTSSMLPGSLTHPPNYQSISINNLTLLENVPGFPFLNALKHHLVKHLPTPSHSSSVLDPGTPL